MPAQRSAMLRTHAFPSISTSNATQPSFLEAAASVLQAQQLSNACCGAAPLHQGTQ
jgi:hypothetical protein